MDINAFMKAYNSNTKYADIDGRDFRMMGTVRLDLEARNHEVYIWSIVNLEQSNGQASKALDWLCAQADKYAVPLELFPERMSGHGKGVPTLVLKKWYGSRGFVKDKQYGFYRREPQMKIHATQRLHAAAKNTALATDWPSVGLYGMEGTYSTVFVGSPNTADKFVQYLHSVGAKDVNTGRRGKEYMISWNKVSVDVADWKRKGFPVHAAQRLQAGRETGEGAGALFYSPSTQRFLIMLRADDGDDGNVWCCLGGGRDVVDGIPEKLETTVRRESWEEAGLPMDTPYELIHVGTKYYEDGFRFHNFLAIIPEEFLPLINEEHKSFQWCSWEDFPKEMHQGMMSVFNSSDGQRVLQHYTTALDQY